MCDLRHIVVSELLAKLRAMELTGGPLGWHCAIGDLRRWVREEIDGSPHQSRPKDDSVRS